MGSPDAVSLDALRRLRPAAATGVVRRTRRGAEEDAAAFAFLAPARWRVRHADGTEIVVRGEDWWERVAGGGDWSHQTAETGTEVHHNGYLKAMLFPALLPAVSDAGSVVRSQERLASGGRRLKVAYREPVEGEAVLDVSDAGHLSRLAGRDDGGEVVIELDLHSSEPPPETLFDPAEEWTPPGFTDGGAS